MRNLKSEYRFNRIFISSLICICFARGAGFAETRDVSFQTTDGWTIYGTLHLPDDLSATDRKVPGVVMLHSPGYDRSTYGPLARSLGDRGLASLRIDWRGSGESLKKGNLELPFEGFTPSEGRKVYLDVQAAIDFLAVQEGVDQKRIGVIGSRFSANHAALVGVDDWRVKTLVLFSGNYDPQVLEEIALRSDLPILNLASREDQVGFRGSTQIHTASTNEESKILLPARGGYGTTMLSYNKGLDGEIVEWLVDKLKGLGHEQEISFETEDGWTITGALHLPDDMDAGGKIPAVLLVHGARHDRNAYHHLAPLLVKKNLAVLRIDWRGRGKSRFKDGKKHDVDQLSQSDDGWIKVHVDVKAAIDFLASLKGVDPDRIGVVAATFATNQVLLAAQADSRLKTIVVVTSYVLDDKSKSYLASDSSPPILFLASREDYNHRYGSLAEFTVEAHSLAKNPESRLVMYEGLGRGTAMFHTNPEIEPMITEWVAEKLQAAH